MAEGVFAFPARIFSPIRPRRPVVTTNFTLAYDSVEGTLTFDVPTAVSSDEPILFHHLEIRGPNDERRVFSVAPSNLPLVVSEFNPEEFPLIWRHGVATWDLPYTVWSTSEDGDGPPSALATEEISQSGQFSIPAGDWTYTEVRESVAAAGVTGKQAVTLDAGVEAPPNQTIRVYSGTLNYIAENFATIHSIANTTAITPGASLELTPGFAAGTTLFSVKLYYDPAANLWTLASEDVKSFNVLGILDPAKPQNTVAPAITGTAKVGSTLTCSTGTWTGSPSFTRQWLRGGLTISGQTASTYLLAAADDLASISCQVTGTNAGGAVAALSNAVAITRVAPVATGSLSNISEDQEPSGGSVSFDASGEFSGAALTFSVSGHAAVTIDPETGLGTADLTNAVSVTTITVTASNSGGSDALTFSLTVTAGAGTITPPDDVADNLWSVVEITDPEDADAGTGGILRATFGAITVDPSGFTLRHALRQGTTPAPDPSMPAVTAGTVVETITPLAVGATYVPRLWWLHTSSSQMFLASAKASAVIQGLTETPPATGFPALSAAAITQAKAAQLVTYNTTFNGTGQAFSNFTLTALGYAIFQGDATCDGRGLQAIRNCLGGSTCPSGQGGFAMMHEISWAALVAFCRMTPRVWDQLTSGEKTKIDVLMQGMGYSGLYQSAEVNATRGQTLVGRPSNYDGNANFSVAPAAMVAIFRAYLGSDAALLSFRSNASKAAIHSLCSNQSLSNMMDTMRPRSGSSGPTNESADDAVQGCTIRGNAVTNVQGYLVNRANFCFNKDVESGYGGNAGNGWIGPGVPASGNARGKIQSGAAGLPNKGSVGMAQEFDTVDAEGVRVSASYVMWGYRSIMAEMAVMMAAGLLNRNAAAIQTLHARLQIGVGDFKYKSDNGFLSYAHGGGSGSDTWTNASHGSSWVWACSFSVWFEALDVWLADI